MNYRQLTLISISFLMHLMPPRASAQDVYNFYFQKAPGPQTVIQGGAGASQPSNVQVDDNGVIQQQNAPGSSTAPINSAASTSTVATTKTLAEPNDLKKWSIGIGYGEFKVPYISDGYGGSFARAKYTGFALNANYNVSKYFGFDAGFISGRLDESSNEVESTCYDCVSDGTDSHYTYYDPAALNDKVTQIHLGMRVTPVHVQLFGHNLLEVSLLAGGNGITDKVNRNLDIDDTHRKVNFYYGLRTAVTLNPNFEIAANYQINSKWDDAGTLTALASVRF